MNQTQEDYFSSLQENLSKAYEIAQHARKLMLDPDDKVEIKLASDVASRVEGLVGPAGIASEIRKLEQQGKSREVIAKELVVRICKGEFFNAPAEKLIEQAVRTGVCLLTEGVLVAPTEGIAGLKIHRHIPGKDEGNPDGSSYLAIYFAGPIRSAGGTASAQAVLLADLARRQFNIGRYRPTETEIERYVEEMTIYNDRCARLQYKPTDDELRHIVRNCPVCVSGEPTEEIEVSIYRDLKRVKTNRIRGGAILVLCEGIAQKASKVFKYASTLGFEQDWGFLAALSKGVRKTEQKFELKADNKFLDEVVAGRPIFSFSMANGGFRLRYGRTRSTGIAAKAIHPATMYILNSFLAVGTQIKIDRPGKGAVVSPADSIMGPIVKLKDGSVEYITDVSRAKEIVKENLLEQILFLGDILVSYGDFLKANHPLLPSPFVEEWWEQIALSKQIKFKKPMLAQEAFELSLKHSIPLHPNFLYFWEELNNSQIKELAIWLFENATLNFDFLGSLKDLVIEASPTKRYLELIGLPHKVLSNKIIIDKENAFALILTLGLYKKNSKKLSFERFEKLFDLNSSVLENLTKLSGVKIMPKAPVYLGVRMGRPEKAKPRQMSPPVHVLFPVGFYNRSREILKYYSKLKSSKKSESGYEAELANLRCTACKKINYRLSCSYCSNKCVFEPVQIKKANEKEKSEVFYTKKNIDLVKEVDLTKKRLGNNLPEIKGVEGLISSYKIPEILDKGFLRAKYNLTIFRDGTCRFDSTDMPLLQFKPKEIETSIEKLHQLGYLVDIENKPLKSPDQLVALKVQDIIIPKKAADYLFNVSKFIDELLVEVYQLKPFYKLKSKEDLIGQLCIGLSPHTSAGVLCRIIGFTDAQVCFAHPYFHCAKRRNCDGDEDSIILLLDALLNFSVKFLPSSRGGTMDSPLILTTKIDPLEVDDEVHCMEVVDYYPLEFYEKTHQFVLPSEVKITTVKDLLGKSAQYDDLKATHLVSSISLGPLATSYTALEKKMEKKIEFEFELEDKIRSVNAAEVAKKVLLSHFLPDIYGNLRSFSRQEFRCSDCNTKYRRVPLKGKCLKCGGNLLLTIYKAGIEKYLKATENLIERYKLEDYLKQRLELIKKDINSIFVEDKPKQVHLSDFM